MSDFCMQPLERRTHLSVTPSVVADECPEVNDARSGLQETVVQYRHDRRELVKDLADIRADIRDEIIQLKAGDPDAFEAAIKPLQQEFADVLKAQGSALKDARDAITDKRDEWAPILASDTKAFIDAHRSGDSDAEAAARAKLESDRNQMKEDVKPLKDALDGVLADTKAQVDAARKAIYDAYADLSPTLGGLLDKLQTTADAGREKLIADNGAVVSAQSTLKDAIADCVAEHGGHMVAT